LTQDVDDQVLGAHDPPEQRISRETPMNFGIQKDIGVGRTPIPGGSRVRAVATGTDQGLGRRHLRLGLGLRFSARESIRLLKNQPARAARALCATVS
jgi:hypothetical protein